MEVKKTSRRREWEGRGEWGESKISTKYVWKCHDKIHCVPALKHMLHYKNLVIWECGIVCKDMILLYAMKYFSVVRLRVFHK